MKFRKLTLPAPATSAVALPEPPSFSELNEREALFVVEYVARSGTPGAGADSAQAAGFSPENRNAAHAVASRLLRRPAVLRALKDETGRRLAAAGPLGVAVLEQLAQSARSEQVRLAAATSLIDRGFGPVVSRNASTSVNVNTSLEDIINRLDREEATSRNTEGSGRVIDITPVVDGTE